MFLLGLLYIYDAANICIHPFTKDSGYKELYVSVMEDVGHTHHLLELEPFFFCLHQRARGV